VFEGLSKGAMAKIEKLVPLDAPNSDKLKILKNKKVLFQERMYMDFNARIKMIKMRDTLHEVVLNPDIYLRKKVDFPIFDTIIKLNRLRNADNLDQTRAFDLYPRASNLEKLARLYGGFLTRFD
jgi:hypothetical protein